MSKARTSKKPVASKRSEGLQKRSPQSVDSSEPRSQVTLQMRESLHRELARKAFDSGMTMRGYIMRALQKAGLRVTDEDLVDRRRR